MIAAVVLAVGVWFSTDNAGNVYCTKQVSESVWTDCVIKVGEETNEAGITSDIWEYKGMKWAGNPFCLELGFMPSNPEAFDKGACQPR